MSWDDAAAHAMLDDTATDMARIALHTGDPGAGSANEVSGGGYARQPVTWAAGAVGQTALSAPADFDVPAVTITWITIWNAAGTVRYTKAQLASPAVFATPGVFTLDGYREVT